MKLIISSVAILSTVALPSVHGAGYIRGASELNDGFFDEEDRPTQDDRQLYGSLGYMEECWPREANVPGYRKCESGLHCMPRDRNQHPTDFSDNRCIPTQYEFWGDLV